MGWLGKIYRKIWSRVGGRPFTYVIRDFSYENPMMILLIGAMAGILVAPVWNWWWLVLIIMGVIFGHLWWGKKYIHNQHDKVKARRAKAKKDASAMPQ